jgi:hypothetical protein
MQILKEVMQLQESDLSTSKLNKIDLKKNKNKNKKQKIKEDDMTQ